MVFAAAVLVVPVVPVTAVVAVIVVAVVVKVVVSDKLKDDNMMRQRLCCRQNTGDDGANDSCGIVMVMTVVKQWCS